MPKDTKKARRARAKALREEITEMNTPPPQGEANAAPPGAAVDESPREFVERRMAELDQKKKKTRKKK